MKGPAESGQICSVGRRKIAKEIAKNKRCYANTLRKDAVEGGLGGSLPPLGHLRRGSPTISALGRGCCRAAGHAADRQSAALSVAAGADHGGEIQRTIGRSLL
jgi:hypothetical protein